MDLCKVKSIVKKSRICLFGNPKIESTLFVPEKLTFSENLRCLNLALLEGGLSQKRSPSSSCFVIADQRLHSGKFKYLRYSQNGGINSVDFISAENLYTSLFKDSLNKHQKSTVGKIQLIQANYCSGMKEWGRSMSGSKQVLSQLNRKIHITFLT